MTKTSWGARMATVQQEGNSEAGIVYKYHLQVIMFPKFDWSKLIYALETESESRGIWTIGEQTYKRTRLAPIKEEEEMHL
jgi:hypothetical protein